MHIIYYIHVDLYLNAYNENTRSIFKGKKKEVNISQEELAERAGIALTVIRKIEQGKNNLNLEKVNHVLKMFGHELAPVSIRELSPNRSNTKL